MLTLEENRSNFKALKICSALNLLPLQIDMQTGRIQKQSSEMKSFLWRILFCCGIGHLLYVAGRLIQSTILEPEKYFRWDHFVFHFACAFGFCGLYYIGFWLFGKNPEEYVIIFNHFFKERENPVQKMLDEELQINPLNAERQGASGTGIKSAHQTTSFSGPFQEKEQEPEWRTEAYKKSGSNVRPLLSWPPQYSLHELLIKILPPALVATSIFGAIVLAIDPRNPQLLYSCLPPKYQNIYIFSGLLPFEAFFFLFIFVFCCCSILGQLLFFEKCQAEFKRLDLQLRNLKEKFQHRLFKSRDLRREIWILREISNEIKELVLFIELFNSSFPPCIYALKLICLAVPVLYYFFTIRHFHEFPFLAAFTGYCAVLITIVYGILYQHAFSIPAKMERLKCEFLFTVSKSTSFSFSSSSNSAANPLEKFRAEMERKVGGIGDVGVKVGSFHRLERESTPTFIDFVLRNVVNLLVTFSG